MKGMKIRRQNDFKTHVEVYWINVLMKHLSVNEVDLSQTRNKTNLLKYNNNHDSNNRNIV